MRLQSKITKIEKYHHLCDQEPVVKMRLFMPRSYSVRGTVNGPKRFAIDS